MTREEAIYELGEWLEQMIQHGVPSHSAKRKALATAIALLSAETHDKRTETHGVCSDLISRANVFEIIDKAFSQPMRDGVTLYADICLMLNALPTHANSRSTHARDLISRADAIDAVWKLDKEATEYVMDDTHEIHGYCTAIGVCVGELSALPSADAVHGEWIMHIDDLFPEESTQECSNCHEHETIKIRSDNFCSNCGAKMDGERREP